MSQKNNNIDLDFIQCLLKKDPRERLTADEALMHPWLKDVGISG